jgi:hypothetical protein
MRLNKQKEVKMNLKLKFHKEIKKNKKMTLKKRDNKLSSRSNQ